MSSLVVRLTGGLGNQMFQYACGRAIADRYAMDLRLDASQFGRDRLRPYSLGALCITAAKATRREMACFYAPWPARVLRRAFGYTSRHPGMQPSGQIIAEQGLGFQAVDVDPTRPVLLTGYWQSEKYFAHLRDALLIELAPRQPAAGRNAELLARIHEEESICVHVRRGDYVSHAKTSAAHGTCDARYYETALERLLQAGRRPSVFVFSDDPTWTRRHIVPPGVPCTYVDHNGPGQPWEDLRLMAAGRRFVIANSTFSWWGAWLSNRKDKTVIAPAVWFRDASRDGDGIVPDGWMRM